MIMQYLFPSRMFFSVLFSPVLAMLVLATPPSSVVAESLAPLQTLLLWPDGAPGAVGELPQDRPTMTVYPVSRGSANRCGVVVCPGGGYGGHAMAHEGHEIASWFNSFGVTAFVLKYRLGKRYPHPAPIQDLQRAIRYVRAHAKEFNVEENRIGVIGFSAGGHLASTAATHFDAGKPNDQDHVNRKSCRPDFAILCYPVITMKLNYTHRGSRNNLLGPNPDPALVESLSNELQVTPQTPPTFLFHTEQDQAVPVMNSILFYEAMIEHGVKGELHLFQTGRHGVGLAKKIPGTSAWTGLVENWMNANGWTK